jgi:membrane protein
METERKRSVSGLVDFLNTGIWSIPVREQPGMKGFLIRQVRIFLLAARGFTDDRCQLRASALTYYSLLSVVPLVAMAFGVSKGFGIEKRLEKQILQALPGQQEVSARIIEYAHTFLENTKGGIIAGVGVAVLFWAVVRLMGNIEKSFNDIWGVRKGRSLGRKFSDYLSLMIIAPLLFVMASSATVLITSQVTVLTDKVEILASAGPLVPGLLKLLPYGAVWILFTLLYVLMPNTTVRIKSGLLGGILAGTMYQIVQWVYIKFQVGVSTYGAIYGSFAALPLFLVWLQTSWLVVLLGAEISFAEQNVDTYEFEPDFDKVSNNLKRLVALRLTQLCVQDFQASQSPRTAEQFSELLGIPVRLIRQVLSDLTEARVLSEVRTEADKTMAYQPSRPVDSLTVGEVIHLLDDSGLDQIPYGESPEWERLTQRLALFSKTIRESSANVAIKDL